MNNPTPTQPPQGVMAPAEALAVLVDCADVLDDHGKANRARLLTGARATFVALLDEVEALRQERDSLALKNEANYEDASALLARCEGLEADARRFRWMAENCHTVERESNRSPHVVVRVVLGEDEQGRLGLMRPGHSPGVGIPSLELAIDAAIVASRATGGNGNA